MGRGLWGRDSGVAIHRLSSGEIKNRTHLTFSLGVNGTQQPPETPCVRREIGCLTFILQTDQVNPD